MIDAEKDGSCTKTEKAVGLVRRYEMKVFEQSAVSLSFGLPALEFSPSQNSIIKNQIIFKSTNSP